MDSFIHNENLKLWRRHLAQTKDPSERAVLLNLIGEEENRASDLDNRPSQSDVCRNSES
jgi:hypothetical protein